MGSSLETIIRSFRLNLPCLSCMNEQDDEETTFYTSIVKNT